MPRISAFLITLVLGSMPLLASGQDTVLHRLYGDGVHAYFAGDYVKAHEHLTAAIEGGMSDPRAHYFRALCYTQLGRDEMAEEDFDKGAELEARSGRMEDVVGRALTRIQGVSRTRLENHRQEARLAAYRQKNRAATERFSGGQPSSPPADIPEESGTESPPPGDLFPPTDDSPPDDAGGADPFGDLGGAPDPAPLEAAPADAGTIDPFGAPAPADGGGADPFGAPAPADGGGADPFGGPGPAAGGGGDGVIGGIGRALGGALFGGNDATPPAAVGGTDEGGAKATGDPFGDDPVQPGGGADPFGAPAPANDAGAGGADPFGAPAPAGDGGGVDPFGAPAPADGGGADPFSAPADGGNADPFGGGGGVDPFGGGADEEMQDDPFAN